MERSPRRVTGTGARSISQTRRAPRKKNNKKTSGSAARSRCCLETLFSAPHTSWQRKTTPPHRRIRYTQRGKHEKSGTRRSHTFFFCSICARLLLGYAVPNKMKKTTITAEKKSGGRNLRRDVVRRMSGGRRGQDEAAEAASISPRT